LRPPLDSQQNRHPHLPTLQECELADETVNTSRTTKEGIMNDYLDDDENVKAMRETARTIGLTQLLVDIARSPANMGSADSERLHRALALLGEAAPQ
jgi:hypothetical protein